MLCFNLGNDEEINLLIDSIKRNKTIEDVKQEFAGTKYDKTMEEYLKERK